MPEMEVPMTGSQVLRSEAGVMLIKVTLRDTSGAGADRGYLVRGPHPADKSTICSKADAETRFVAALARTASSGDNRRG
jgi:hypothetical protein